MALADTVQKIVNGVLSKTLESFKGDVTFTPWIGDDGRGTDAYGTPRTLRCIVDMTRVVRYTTGGGLLTIVATLQFVDPITSTTANAGKVRANPVDPRDIFTLPDGSTAPVLNPGGTIYPGTNAPFAMEVRLGTITRGE